MIAILGGPLLVLGASWALGRASWRGRAPHWTLEMASGAALLSTALFFLLVLRWAHPLAVLALCAACLATLAVPPRPRWPRLCRPPWPVVLLTPFFFYYLIHALAPEIQPDAAGYHLGIVADWARRHGMTPRIGFYDLLPLGLETLFYPAFLAGGHSAAKLVHFGLFASTVPLLAHAGRKSGLSSAQAWCAAGLYFLTPVAAVAGTSAYNDAASVFFAVAAFAILLENRPDMPWARHAGLQAGFSYAIKITGLAVAAGLALWFLWRRRWRQAAWAAAAAALCVLPWMVRNASLTGNPLAPVANRLFPNDAFHAHTEEELARYLAAYGGIGWENVPWSLAVDGTALQGLIGPLLFVLPLALLAWRKPQGRLVLAAAALLLLPWVRNLGARFFLPALALFFLALAMAAGRRLAAVLLAVQAAVCCPWLAGRYAGVNAWRLKGLPVRAALRIEPEHSYLERLLDEYAFTRRAAELIGGGRLLDLYGLPFSYLQTAPTGPHSSAVFDNLATTLAVAQDAAMERVSPLTCRFPLQFVGSVRVRLEAPWPGMWSIDEVRFEQRRRTVRVSPLWLLDAWPNPGDAWLAVDLNPATRWYTWDATGPGAYWQVTFDRPLPIDTVIVRTRGADPRLLASLYLQTPAGVWKNVTPLATAGEPVRAFQKRDATRAVKHLGYGWIAVRLGRDGFGPLGNALLAMPDTWGVEVALRGGQAALLRIR